MNDVYYKNLRPYILPNEITPTSYHLEIDPFISIAKFNARVKINLTWVDTSDRITLNVHSDLQILDTDIKMIQLAPEDE